MFRAANKTDRVGSVIKMSHVKFTSEGRNITFRYV